MKTKSVFMVKIAPAGWNEFIQFSSNFIPSVGEVKEIVEDLEKKTFYPKKFIDACLAGVQAWGMPRECKKEVFRQWKSPGDYSTKGYVAVKVIDIYFK